MTTRRRWRRRVTIEESPFDLESDRLRARRRFAGRVDSRPEVYRRVVANPFLAILWIVGCCFAVRGSVAIKNLPFFGLSFIAMTFATVLFQFHCLDCGRTGRLVRWKEHACESVNLRLLANAPRRWRGPAPGFQTLFMILSFGGIVAVVLLGAARRWGL